MRMVCTLGEVSRDGGGVGGGGGGGEGEGGGRGGGGGGGGIKGHGLHRREWGQGVSDFKEEERGKGTQTTDEGRGTRDLLRLQRM